MRALFPGSFDPPHLGHLDLIRRAAALFDELVVGVAGNPDKQAFLAVDERVALLRADCAGLANVRVAAYQGATTAFAAANGCGMLVRGLRNAGDLEAEQAMAEINRGNGSDTLLLPAQSAHIHLSSRLVRQVLAAQLPLTGLVSAAVAAALLRRLAGARPQS
jgi:pantetheine-phosphate adenylyltransferase